MMHNEKRHNEAQPSLKLEVEWVSPQPILHRNTPGAEDVNYGFEGGTVIRGWDDAFHWFTAERFADPMLVKMRLAHWKSADGDIWIRQGTLYESSGDFTGEDPRAAFWGPMPVFDEASRRWALFYVAYRAKPNTQEAWYENHDGRIWLAYSTKEGWEGLAGPYQDVGVILEPDEDSQDWEGLQGVDSFFPYQSGDHWLAFYGSAQTQYVPCRFWGTGLAEAPTLMGPWKRRTMGNPVKMDQLFAENPVVVRVGETWVALVDGGPCNGTFGYATSRDGLIWSRAIFLDVTGIVTPWWEMMRTPLCLLPDEDGRWTLFFTALQRMGSSDYGALGRARIRIRAADPGTSS